MPSLAAGYRIIAIDLAGNGLTGETGARDYSRAGVVAFVHSVLGALGADHEALVLTKNSENAEKSRPNLRLEFGD